MHNYFIKCRLPFLIICFSLNSFAQSDTAYIRYLNLDTVETYINITLKTGSDGFWVNEQRVNKRVYDRYKEVMEKANNCKPCWLKEFSIDGNLVSEGAYYGPECRIGSFIEYSKGKFAKIVAHYKENRTGNWSDLYGRQY